MTYLNWFVGNNSLLFSPFKSCSSWRTYILFSPWEGIETFHLWIVATKTWAIPVNGLAPGNLLQCILQIFVGTILSHTRKKTVILPWPRLEYQTANPIQHFLECTRSQIQTQASHCTFQNTTNWKMNSCTSSPLSFNHQTDLPQMLADKVCGLLAPVQPNRGKRRKNTLENLKLWGRYMLYCHMEGPKRCKRGRQSQQW